jgi:hypothetical protein
VPTVDAAGGVRPLLEPDVPVVCRMSIKIRARCCDGGSHQCHRRFHGPGPENADMPLDPLLEAEPMFEMSFKLPRSALICGYTGHGAVRPANNSIGVSI